MTTILAIISVLGNMVQGYFMWKEYKEKRTRREKELKEAGEWKAQRKHLMGIRHSVHVQLARCNEIVANLAKTKSADVAESFVHDVGHFLVAIEGNLDQILGQGRFAEEQQELEIDGATKEPK